MSGRMGFGMSVLRAAVLYRHVSLARSLKTVLDFTVSDDLSLQLFYFVKPSA